MPCVSTLTSPLAAPTITGQKVRKRAPVGIIVTSQLYTLKYALKPKKSGLSAGAKAGIAIGIVVAAMFGALLVAFIVHKRKLKNQGLREGAIIGGGSSYGGFHRSGTMSHAGSQPGHPSELPSPSMMPQGMVMNGSYWIPPPNSERGSSPPPPPIPAQELPASTHMHEHHPAFQALENVPEQQEGPPFINHDESRMSGGIISPMEAPVPR
ncbi:MAG: hypothetical protein Q9220_004704 [cf. Caloplaca sp. 1 TL-2023]